jgi:hypothetical protein
VATAIVTAVQTPVIVVVGRVRPSLEDTITRSTGTNNSGPQEDMEGAVVKFSMRLLLSRVPVIDEADARGFSTNQTTGANVAYDWEESDVEEEGEFMGWWTFTLIGESNPIDTPEFPITITSHGPGIGTQTGAIVDGVASEIPITFEALRNDIAFGDRFMQNKAELIKYKVLGTTVPPEQEAMYHPVLLDYFSKRVSLELIKPAIDYWSRQHKTVTTTGTSEVASYPDMIASLEKQKTYLIDACKMLWQEVQFLVPGLPQRRILHLPTSDMTGHRERYITPDPKKMLPLETGRWLEFDGALGVFPFP